MRRQVYFLSFIILLLIAFSSFAYSHYQITNKILDQKNLCCKQNNSADETIFELMVKQVVGAVSTDN